MDALMLRIRTVEARHHLEWFYILSQATQGTKDSSKPLLDQLRADAKLGDQQQSASRPSNNGPRAFEAALRAASAPR